MKNKEANTEKDGRKGGEFFLPASCSNFEKMFLMEIRKENERKIRINTRKYKEN